MRAMMPASAFTPVKRFFSPVLTRSTIPLHRPRDSRVIRTISVTTGRRAVSSGTRGRMAAGRQAGVNAA
jgi:hypothetical protein